MNYYIYIFWQHVLIYLFYALYAFYVLNNETPQNDYFLEVFNNKRMNKNYTIKCIFIICNFRKLTVIKKDFNFD